jgi:serine protease Do
MMRMPLWRRAIPAFAILPGLLWAAAAAAAPECGSPSVPRAGRPSFVAAAARNAQAVVNVVVISAKARDEDLGYGDDLFFPLPGGPFAEVALSADAAPERGFSSGFIYSPDGLVLASAHALRDAVEAWVHLPDGRHLKARVVGLDRASDVALLKVGAQGLPGVVFARGETLCPGEWVAAIGSPFGFDASVTAGVVSANPRYLPGIGGLPLIQTDVALNPGSSGGPLFNARGEIVGMNSMIYSSSGGYVGVSFSLPIERVVRIAEQLRAGGRVIRGQIGARTQAVTHELASAFGLYEPRGTLVVRTQPGSAAEAAGMRGGDIILEWDGRPVGHHAQVQEWVAQTRPGMRVPLEIWRDRSVLRLEVVVASSLPDVPRSGEGAIASRPQRLGLVLRAYRVATGSGGYPEGLYVERAASWALLAGIEPGDRVLAVNAVPVTDEADFDRALAAAGGTLPVALLVARGSVQSYIPVGEPPQ